MPSAQKAKGALSLAAIKSTRLVANPNRPEGISAFPVSPYHTTNHYPNPFTLAIPNQLPPYTHVDFLVDWQDISCPCVLVVCLLVAR